MLPRPYAPIIPLGRGPCGRLSEAEQRRGERVSEKEEAEELF